MTPREFARSFGVSRETCERLGAYIAVLTLWNVRINLVARGSIKTAWTRHLADSAQLFELAPENASSWIDLGSGAGLPGLPIAAIAAEKMPALHVTLVESDTRKAAFMEVAAQEMGLNVTIMPQRIETITPHSYDVVSARALAPLDRLCALAQRFSGPGTIFLFPKGARVDSELTIASADWHIRADRIASQTDPTATILRIQELEPRP
jgi:16S rRNA (guanine527-N7)-methyltransferase